MGQPKALLEWEGVPLIEYQIRQLAGVPVSSQAVVLGHEADRLRSVAERALGDAPGVIVENASYRDGKTTSIIAGLRALELAGESVLILAVDEPRSDTFLRRLVAAHRSASRSITVPSVGERRCHPPVFSSEHLEELFAIEERSYGIRAVLERHAAAIDTIEFGAANVPSFNTPAEYVRARGGDSPRRNPDE